MKQLLQTLFFFLLVTQICFSQWVQTNGPYGGDVHCFGASNSNIYAGTWDYGIYRSTNNGINWIASSKDIKYVNTLVTSGANIFAGTGDYMYGYGSVWLSTNNGASWTLTNTGSINPVSCLTTSGTTILAGTFGSGVLLTTDNGANWTEANAGLTSLLVESLIVSGSNLFAGTYDRGVFLSTNNGTSWSATGLTNGWITTFAVLNTNIFAGTGDNKGIFLSTNNGASWTSVNNGLTSLIIHSLAVIDMNLFAATSNGIFLSTNNGAIWNFANSGLGEFEQVNDLLAFGSNIFAGTIGSGIYRSTNSGANWYPSNNGFIHTKVTSLEISDGNIFAGTESIGIFHSTDYGGSWIAGNGIIGSVYDIAISDTNIFACGYGIFRSTDNGISWNATSSGLPNGLVNALATLGTNIFAGLEAYGIFLSTDKGTSWNPTGFPYYNCQTLTVLGTNIFAGTWGAGIFRSTDNGTTWTAVNNGLQQITYASSLVVNGTDILAAVNYGVYRSNDNGDSWTEVGNPSISNCYALDVFETNIFAGTEFGIFCNTNYGSAWIPVNAGLTNSFVLSLLVSDTSLFTGTNGYGVLRRPLSEMVPVELTLFTASANGAEVILNWSTATELNNYGFEIQRKALSCDFSTIAFVKGQGTTTQQNQYSFADKNLDEGKYFYRLKQMDYGGQYAYSPIVEVDVRTLDNYTLEQNYPNPFNPTTTIGYVLQEKSNAKLTLLNSLGEEIAMLVNEEQDKGYHKVDFNAQNLPSGVYLYKLHAGNFMDTKKMILLK